MYGIIDIGSNTIRLKIYKLNEEKIESVVDKKEFAKLISYRKDNNLTEAGIEVCINVLQSFKKIIELLKVDNYYAFATASLRNITNTLEVLSRIKNETGIDVDIISGEDEALYSYLGATSNINIQNGAMIDIGGGSSEIVFFEDDKLLSRYSIPCGSLNMQDTFFNEDNLIDFDTKGIKKCVNENLDNQNIQNESLVLIGVGGTIRALLKLKQKETGLNDKEFSYEDVRRWYQLIKHNPTNWLRFVLKIIPERVYTVTSGLVILKTVMKRIGAGKVIVSEYGVREGYLNHILKSE